MTGTGVIIAGLWVLAVIETLAIIAYALNLRGRPHHHVLAAILGNSITIIVLAGAAITLSRTT